MPRNYAFPLPGLLAIVFVVLKLTDVIGWSWWWILAPAWIPLAAVVVFLAVGAALAAVAGAVLERGQR